MSEGTCCDAHSSPAYGTRQFSIVRRTSRGVACFEVEWLPTRCRRRFGTKQEATAFVKQHESRAPAA